MGRTQSKLEEQGDKVSAGNYEEKSHKVRVKLQGDYTGAVVEPPFGYQQSGLRSGSRLCLMLEGS